MAVDRIGAICDAATMLFLQDGYKKTQMSHIAKAVGVSVGTLYFYFKGKKEVMHFILKNTISPGFINRNFELPISDELFAGLEDEIIAAFESTQTAFAENLKHMGPYSFEALISDAFDLLSKYAVGCLFIEKNQSDVKRLAMYYKEYRQRFFSIMAQYMESFIAQGLVRPLDDVALTSTLIIEILSWWAMDMPYVAYEKRNIPSAKAKEVCLDCILTAYKN